MVFFVPFDGSDLATAALVRAVQFSTVLEEDVLAVAVIPKGNTNHARDRGWLEDDEHFDMRTIVRRLRERVAEVAPGAAFEYYAVDRYAPPGTVAGKLKRVARDHETSMVFVGSQNAGRIVTGLSSVGAKVAAKDAYDVVIVRNVGPATTTKLEETSPWPESGSENY